MDTFDSVLKVVIIHEDLITGLEATTVLNRMAAELESKFEIKSDTWQMDSGIWKFEMLRDPELCEEAVAEAVAADMIIISIRDGGLPASFQDWIEHVLLMKEGGPAALVALVDRKNVASGGSVRPENYLRRLAMRYGLDFFCSTDDQPRHNSAGIESIVSRCDGNSMFWRNSSPKFRPAAMRQPWTIPG